MRIRVKFTVRKKCFPKDYRPALLSFLKKSLELYDKSLLERFYGRRDPIMKKFTMAIFFQQPVYKEDVIELGGDEVQLTISSASPKELLMLSTVLLNAKNKNVELPLAGGNSLAIKGLVTLRQADVEDESIIVKFASPLVLREHDRERNKDRYITVEDDDFAEYFKKIVFNELEMLGYGGYLAKNLSIEPLKARKIFVKAFDMNVDVSIGMFKLSGSREALQLLHDAGAGSRRSQGFGLFNIVY